MPWRVQTLTEYKPNSSIGAVGDQDSGIDGEHVQWQPNPVEQQSEPRLKSFRNLSEDSDASVGNLFGNLQETVFSGHEAATQCEVGDGFDLDSSRVLKSAVLAIDNFEQFLTSAFIRTRGKLTVQMPWEKGAAEPVFKKPGAEFQQVLQKPRFWVGLDEATSDEPADKVVEAFTVPGELEGAVFEQTISAVSENLLNMAVQRWHCIIRVNMLASPTGRDIINLGSIADQKSGAFAVIEAVIGIRSRTTAVTRANSLLKFLRWRADMTGEDSGKISEPEAWGYLCELRDQGAAPTKGSSFLSACAYALHVFGFGDLQSICCSKRLQGVADLMHANKEPLKQARVLTVAQVRWIHEQIENGA